MEIHLIAVYSLIAYLVKVYVTMLMSYLQHLPFPTHSMMRGHINTYPSPYFPEREAYKKPSLPHILQNEGACTKMSVPHTHQDNTSSFPHNREWVGLYSNFLSLFTPDKEAYTTSSSQHTPQQGKEMKTRDNLVTDVKNRMRVG